MPSYHFDAAAFKELVMNAPFMVEEMRRRAEKGKSFAEAIAPYDPADTSLPHYRDLFRVTAGRDGGQNHDRAVGTLWNDHNAAWYIEVGTEDTPAHHTLTKSLDAMGG